MEKCNRTVARDYWYLAWPATVEGMLIMLLTSVDLIMIGTLGTIAISAVGIFSQPKMVILSFSRSLAIAVTAVIARKYGEGETDSLSNWMKQAVVISIAIASVLLILSLFFLEQILRIAGANENYLEPASAYGRIAMVGLFINAPCIIINAGLAGIGYTRSMMISGVTGNVVNVILNYFLIYGVGSFPAMGVTGAAIATLIGSFASLGVAIYFVTSHNSFLTLKGYHGWRPTEELFSVITTQGVTVFIEQGFERIGMFVYSYITAQLGTVAFATHNICMNLCDIYYSFGQGLSKASLVMFGQSIGANKPNKSIAVARVGQKMGLMLSSIAFLLYFSFRSSLMGLFSTDPEVIMLGQQILLFVAICSFPQTQALICAGMLRGAGETKYIAKYSFWSIAIIRPILTWVLCFYLDLGLHGAWTALAFDQTLRMLCSSIRLRWVTKGIKGDSNNSNSN